MHGKISAVAAPGAALHQVHCLLWKVLLQLLQLLLVSMLPDPHACFACRQTVLHRCNVFCVLLRCNGWQAAGQTFLLNKAALISIDFLL